MEVVGKVCIYFGMDFDILKYIFMQNTEEVYTLILEYFSLIDI